VLSSMFVTISVSTVLWDVDMVEELVGFVLVVLDVSVSIVI
jgi:hypothetical protein